MAEVRWERRASDDLVRIIRYIEQFDPPAADRIGSRLVALGDSLRDFAERGRPAPDGRGELVTVPPYVLSYTFDGVTARVERIRHGRQQR